MELRQGLVRHLTGPWAGGALLLSGLALGTWAPSLAGPFQTLVRAFLSGLAQIIPIVILVSILPALLSLFATGSGRAPIIVILLFTASTVVAGTFALLLAWAIFQLPLAVGEGGGGISSALSAIDADAVFGSPAMFAVIWSFASAIVLHVLLLLDGRVRTHGSWPRRAFGGLTHFAKATIRVFAWLGEEGVAYVGRGLRYVLPFLLFSVGAFVPAAVEDAASAASAASSNFSALPWYLATAGLIAATGFIYLLLVAYVASRYAGTPLKPALSTYLPPVYAFAWASSSSSVTIPVNLEAAQRGLQVNRSTREFVIPLGATINLDGTMIAAVFLTPIAAKALGITITVGQLIATMVPLLAITVGAPGLPAGVSFIAPPVIASVLGLGGDAAAAFIGVWFAFSLGLTDQFRTSVNSVNNGFLCLIVDRLIGGERMEVWLEELDDHHRSDVDGSATPVAGES